MLLRLGAVDALRRIGFGRRSVSTNNLVKDLFLDKIKQYGSKMAGKEGVLVDATPETERSLQDQLQRLASKYRLESPEKVKELPVKKLQTAQVESALSAMLGGKTLDDLNKELEQESKVYVEMRQRKKAEEEALATHLRATEQQQQPHSQK